MYGVLIAPSVALPEFPLLTNEDQDILQPLPNDNAVCGPDTPFDGFTLCQVTSSFESNMFCMNDQPTTPELFRLAFYLFGRIRLVHGAVTRMWKSGETRMLKRPATSDDMVAH